MANTQIINAILVGQAARARDLISQALATKTIKALDTRKIQVAKGMFKEAAPIRAARGQAINKAKSKMKANISKINAEIAQIKASDATPEQKKVRIGTLRAKKKNLQSLLAFAPKV